MSVRAAAFAVLAFTLSSRAAQAHDFVAGAGYLNGLLHPLLVPAHALCLFAFGLMTGQQSRPHRVVLIVLFPAVLIAGVLLIMAATFPLNIVPLILLSCGVAAGLLTAWAQPLPLVITGAILAAGGLSLIFDSVPSVISKLDTILALGGTTLASSLVVGLTAFAAARATRDWQQIGVRILGSWTAASALLVLTLQFVDG